MWIWGVESLRKRKLRFAVIGLGKMGLLHASILNVIPNVELVALVDKSALMNRLYKRIFSSKVVGNLMRCLNSGRLVTLTIPDVWVSR